MRISAAFSTRCPPTEVTLPRLLIVSPHFPPVNAPDMQRVRMSLPHFVALGWEVTVLAGDDDHPQAPVEPELLATVPAEVRVVPVKPWSRRWTARFGVNNLGLRIALPLYRAGRRLLRKERFDVVYFSTTQFATLPLGRLWRAEFGAPYVIDLQDPWVSDYYKRTGNRPPGGWKYVFARAQAALLEGWTLRRCAHVISVSPDYLTALQGRHAWFGATQGTTVTFGAPEADFALLARRRGTLPSLLPAVAGPRLAYAGRLGPDMAPALDLLFAAVAALRHGGGPVFRLYFFGTSYAAAGAGQSSTAALAARHGIADLVVEHTARIPYLDALRLVLETDIALILGSDETAYSPSKIYPTLLAERPTLALAPAGSVLEQKLLEIGGAWVCKSGPVEPERVAELARILGRLAAGENPAVNCEWSREKFLANHGATALAARQSGILLRVAESSR